MRRALTNAFASCSFRAAAAETSNPVFLQGGDLVRVRSKNAARQTLQNTLIVRDDAPTMRSMSRAYCTRHNDDTEEGFAAKTWEHARRSAREGWQSARDSNENDADEDDGIKRVEGGSISGVNSTPPPRVISPRDFAGDAWMHARGDFAGRSDARKDGGKEHVTSWTIEDIDSGRKLMKDWTPRETLEFIERGATPEDARDFMDDETIREYEAMKRRIDEAPAKQKRFLLNQALKGRVFSKHVEDEENQEREALVKSLQQKVIDVNRTCKVTKGGGLMNFTAMVVVGNGRGVVGFATGKANEVGPAIEKATKKAARSLTFVERFENHTIFHELRGKCGKTRVKMMPSPSGSGRRCNDIIDAICELAGIRDLKAKVTGSHHPHNTVRAVFEAFERMQTPAAVAARRGMKVYQV